MKKKNLRYQITYILFILFFMAGAIFYRQSFLAILLILVCILPIVSIYLTITLGKNITFKTYSKTGSVTVGNDIILNATIKNPFILPFLNCEVTFSLQNLFYENDTIHELALSAPAKKEHTISIPIHTKYSGMCEIQFTSLEITDYLHLYTITLPLKDFHQIPIMPNVSDRDFPIFPALFDTEDDEDFAANVGLQSYDIKELREFRPGDRQNSIHWKMSSKTDDLLVKEMERTASRVLLLIPEFDKSKLEPTLITLWSYLKFLVKNREIFKVCLFNHKTKEFFFRLITNEDEALECLLASMFMPAYVSSDLALKMFKEVFGEDKTVITIIGESIKEN